MNFVIAICGDSGSGKTFLAEELCQMFSPSRLIECDSYHRWERSDWHWKYATHLDPSSNKLDEMVRDIGLLAQGSPAYIRTYDHKSGTLLAPTKIEPAKFIIVCGLHSFAIPSNGKTVKVFLDTEKNLKMIWKLNRDFFERGYNVLDILSRIQQREVDFQNFILPQINQADIILKNEFIQSLRRRVFVSPRIPTDTQITQYQHTFETNEEITECIVKALGI